MLNRYHLFKTLNLVVFCSFYIGAGINHFWHPRGYLDLIPPYLPWHPLLNILSGIFEISGGILMIIPSTRRLSAIGLILLLILLVPAHIYMIQMGGCVSQRMCVSMWVAIVRLPLQVILIWWAWKTYKTNAGQISRVLI